MCVRFALSTLTHARMRVSTSSGSETAPVCCWPQQSRGEGASSSAIPQGGGRRQPSALLDGWMNGWSGVLSVQKTLPRCCPPSCRSPASPLSPPSNLPHHHCSNRQAGAGCGSAKISSHRTKQARSSIRRGGGQQQQLKEQHWPQQQQASPTEVADQTGGPCSQHAAGVLPRRMSQAPQHWHGSCWTWGSRWCVFAYAISSPHARSCRLRHASPGAERTQHTGV